MNMSTFLSEFTSIGKVLKNLSMDQWILNNKHSGWKSKNLTHPINLQNKTIFWTTWSSFSSVTVNKAKNKNLNFRGNFGQFFFKQVTRVSRFLIKLLHFWPLCKKSHQKSRVQIGFMEASRVGHSYSVQKWFLQHTVKDWNTFWLRWYHPKTAWHYLLLK